MLPWNPAQSASTLSKAQQPLQQNGQQGQPALDMNGSSGGAAGTGAAGQPTAPLNLASVLHFLQTEWRRYERERNEWEIERSEMRARIALLEGERRGNENIKTDLMRRVKMLEYALRQERLKNLSSNPQSSQHQNQSAAAASTTAAKESSNKTSSQEQPSKKNEASSNEQQLAKPDENPPSPEPSSGSRLPNTEGNYPYGSSNFQTWNSSLGRDPRLKTRSRAYLKQCLQEINYLTSPTTMNPLSDTAANGISRPPRKQLVEIDAPMLQALQQQRQQPQQPQQSQQSQQQQQSQSQPQQNDPTLQEQQEESFHEQQTDQADPTNAAAAVAASTVIDTSNESTSSEDAKSQDESLKLANSEHTSEEDKQGSNNDEANSAEGGEEGKECSSEHEGGDISNRNPEGVIGNDGIAAEAEPEQDQDQDQEQEQEQAEPETEGDGLGGSKLWKVEKTLMNHLDSVRCLGFERKEDEVTLASGGDDCTVKVWRLAGPSLMSKASRGASLSDAEPQMTFRGHSGVVTCAAIKQGRVFSGSMDQTVRVWKMVAREPQAPFDPSLCLGVLEGHTDAVWDVELHPYQGLLFTVSSDGTCKVWNTDEIATSPLKLSWGYNGTEADDGGDNNHNDDDNSNNDGDNSTTSKVCLPTSVSVCDSDMRKVAVSWTNGVVKLYSIETGKEVIKLCETSSDGKIIGGQINQVVTHPTLPLVMTAHEDGYIRIFDVNSGTCTHSILAHEDEVTSIDIDPAGLTLVSASHDQSIRFWDMLGSRKCIQEIAKTHVKKANEGTLVVKYHPTLPLLASAGGDGVVKLYSA